MNFALKKDRSFAWKCAAHQTLINSSRYLLILETFKWPRSTHLTKQKNTLQKLSCCAFCSEKNSVRLTLLPDLPPRHRIMESNSARASPQIVSSPLSSPKPGALLIKRIHEWSKETGLPTQVCVTINGKSFHLHLGPLASKSGYFKKALLESFDVELPYNFPGGPEAFEMVALYSYGASLPLDPFNVAALRCAAEFLEMTEEYACGNLCERSHLYLNQVVLQNWEDTLIVLQTCQPLLPIAEELLIISRCVESMAFMACMEILDPERRREQPALTLHALGSSPWNCEAVKEIFHQDLWIKDLIALPFEFFKRIIGSLRRQGMKEKYVSPIIVFYANKWVLSKKTHKYWENTAEDNGAEVAKNKVATILQGILKLLPKGENAGRAVPAAFYFALLSRSLTLGLKKEIQIQLQDQIATLLHLARVEDFLLPESKLETIACSPELKTMESIVLIHISSRNESGYSTGSTPLSEGSKVADLWDQYLSRVAADPKLKPQTFIKLIEILPINERASHDYLYKAVNTFLSAHSNLSNDDKATVSRYLNCQKLSLETCIQIVQDELMPLHLVVQALFVQQMHTHQAFKYCSESFRYASSGEMSGDLLSSRVDINPKTQTLRQSPYGSKIKQESSCASRSFLLQNDLNFQRSEQHQSEYESTSFRIKSLEQELMSLKRSLQSNNVRKNSSIKKDQSSESFRLFGFEGRSVLRRRNLANHGGSCIGSLSWLSQMKYADRILKIFKKIAILGKGRSKLRKAASGLSNASQACRSKSLHEMYDC